MSARWARRSLRRKRAPTRRLTASTGRTDSAAATSAGRRWSTSGAEAPVIPDDAQSELIRNPEVVWHATRHCEPTGPREARPDDGLREAIQSRACGPGLLTWGMCVSRMSSHLFVRLRPPLRPDRGLCRMTRADQVKVGPLGPPRSGLTLS